jgi:uncharacterized protein (TIGR02646 family)
MRRLNRQALSSATASFLGARAQAVRSAAEPREEAKRLWKLQDNAAFREVRETLRSMAPGLECCMYCEDSEGTDIEHFWPKSAYPDKAFSWDNYLLACSGCNSNHKRNQFPVDAAGAPLLINPTSEEPRDHLTLTGRTGKYVAKTPKGQKSIEVFGLWRDRLEKGRQDAWAKLPALLRHYDAACTEQDWRTALEVQRSICRFPFASVFTGFIEASRSPLAPILVGMHSLAVLKKYPDIHDWL